VPHESTEPLINKFDFIDLFAGIGGFHAAMSASGGNCVYAVEIDSHAASVYELNWGINPLGDITLDANDNVLNVPAHNVLCAGFPCQPFSKSGRQRGMDETRGTLYWNILKIIQERKPAIVLLENVRNLVGPRHAHEWKVIIRTLRDAGYVVSDDPAIMSPHRLPPKSGGAPQVRERVFITATYAPGHVTERRNPVVTSRENLGWDSNDWDLLRDLPVEVNLDSPELKLTPTEELWIDAWDEFVHICRSLGIRMPGFPVWADSWGTFSELGNTSLPEWKLEFLRKNDELYFSAKNEFDEWAKKWGVFTAAFPPSRRKFEWQAQDAASLWDTVMHFRPSGIRAKRATYVPALVAITQTSIIGPLRRRLSVQEAQRLQGFSDGFIFGDQSSQKSYKQLGNAVNVGVIDFVLKRHLQRDHDLLLKYHPSLLRQKTSQAALD
jgi:DNA (cytosine-5)-methyltransferase 1